MWIQLKHEHAQMSLAETYVYQITINSFTANVYRIPITVWPPYLFMKGAMKVVIRNKAGTLTSLMGVKKNNRYYEGNKYYNCLLKQSTSSCFPAWDAISINLLKVASNSPHIIFELKMTVACHVRQGVA